MKKLLVLLGVALVCLTSFSLGFVLCKETKAHTTVANVIGNENDIENVSDNDIDALDSFVRETYELDNFTIHIKSCEQGKLSADIYDMNGDTNVGCSVYNNDNYQTVVCARLYTPSY